MPYLGERPSFDNHMRYGLAEPDRLIDDFPVDSGADAVESFLEAIDALRDVIGADRLQALLRQTRDALF